MRVLLTGLPGSGKTTLVRKLVNRLGANAGGFYTEEMREAGKRVGFRILALDGRNGILAHKRVQGTYFVKDKKSEYNINPRDLDEIAADSVLRAVESSEFIVIDEIGHMELFSERFKSAVSAAFDSGKPILATISKYGGEYEESLKARQDVIVIEVSLENRDSLVEEVLKSLLSAP